ncbi:phospholipase A [Desulfogranum marinum]|uniref:phospholipase A n=1 Tax=Desulfogranum marinum TaxID=453220 RepID=UPI0029C7B45E|nr:phospholipase A [Desulfogranum marinum]
MRGEINRTGFSCRQGIVCLGIMLLLTAGILQPGNAVADDMMDCMSKSMQSADPNMTIGELRLQCEKEIQDGGDDKVQEEKQVAVVTDRVHKDRQHVLQPFTLMAHKPNYILLAAYNASGFNSAPWKETFGDPTLEDWEDTEAQFQLSVKFPLLVNMWDDTFDIYAAYTNRSFWQIYYEDSAPFRETNHEPEAWVQFHPDWELFGFKNTWNSFGINHQSNGRGGSLSRSWNRLFAWITVERGNLAMSFKPWYRIPEDDDDDDNPDITDYLGHYELSASYKWGEHVFSVMSRNNLESGFEKGAVELSWSFPLWDWPYLKGYVQYFNGYGRSLIDYNQHSNVIGIGFSVTDWL